MEAEGNGLLHHLLQPVDCMAAELPRVRVHGERHLRRCAKGREQGVLSAGPSMSDRGGRPAKERGSQPVLNIRDGAGYHIGWPSLLCILSYENENSGSNSHESAASHSSRCSIADKRGSRKLNWVATNKLSYQSDSPIDHALYKRA